MKGIITDILASIAFGIAGAALTVGISRWVLFVYWMLVGIYWIINRISQDDRK